jgi:hypothetical protein
MTQAEHDKVVRACIEKAQDQMGRIRRATKPEQQFTGTTAHYALVNLGAAIAAMQCLIGDNTLIGGENGTS